MGCADVRHRELFSCSVSELFLGVSGFFFLDSFSQQSYKTQLQNTALQAIEAEEQEHRISREERGIASSVCPMPGECV